MDNMHAVFNVRHLTYIVQCLNYKAAYADHLDRQVFLDHSL